MAEFITGGKQIRRQLTSLSQRTSKRAVVAGIRGSMTPVAKAMRAAINATDASPELKRAARKSVGRRFKTRKATVRAAKVGVGVGDAKKKQLSQHSSRGVGISVANVHWFVLGTVERYTRGGHRTGRVPPIFEGLASKAFSSSRQAALAAARKKIAAVIAKDAKRRK